MGVFKWLRRERLTVSTGHISPTHSLDEPPNVQMNTIRTEEYKRDLAEFQARRSAGSKDLQETPLKKKCGRHSLPVSCTDCTGDPDTTFNYEKKSNIKYKKKYHKRTRSAHDQENTADGSPNIQFLFQNQVFMPGNVFTTTSYSEPRKTRRCHRSPDFLVQKHIDFNDDQSVSPPLFYKNNLLPFDIKSFIDTSKGDADEVDGVIAGDVKKSSQDVEGKDESCEEKLWEVMSELKNFDKWADEQLQEPSNTSKSDDNKSETSAFGLPVASSCNLDVTIEKSKPWSRGQWGAVPVQLKRLAGVTVTHVRKKLNTEINILRKCRHPNIILLMGLYPDVQNNIHIICERCVDSLFGILHVQGRILSVQTAIHYTLDVANALLFLHMQGFLHTELSSMAVMVTAHDTAKLADVSACVQWPNKRDTKDKTYEVYSPEPQYVNLTDNYACTVDSEPLLSQRSSEAYLASNAVAKNYKAYSESEHYRWQAPELFEPDEDGLVHPCSKSDVYSLCVVLWECCNAILPWKSESYGRVREMYRAWQAGLELPADGRYPGGVLALLRAGLAHARAARPALAQLQATLATLKRDLDEIEYIIIPARVQKNQSFFSSRAWDTTSPTDSECLSPKNIEHEAIIHTRDSSTGSEKESKTSSPVYETIRNNNINKSIYSQKCFLSDEDEKTVKYKQLEERNLASTCSTPVDKIRTKIRDMETPGTLHRSDSTEYCSILSPDTRFANIPLNNDSFKDQSSERPTAKLSRSFTPTSYKPLHIKVPEFNLDSIRTILKDKTNSERSSYNFDITNYSLPSTPIARSNKLRKNAWLSGDINVKTRAETGLDITKTISSKECKKQDSGTQISETNQSLDKEEKSEVNSSKQLARDKCGSSESVDTARDSFTGLRRIDDPPHDFSSPEVKEIPLERSQSLNCMKVGPKHKIDDDLLARMSVKPLVAIHERWIHEANKKTARSSSLPESHSCSARAVKPASHSSHCVDSLQKSLPQLAAGAPRPPSPAHGCSTEPYFQAREVIAKTMSFHANSMRSEKSTITDETARSVLKVDCSTDTLSIEEFIKDLIRKEFQHLLSEISENTSESTNSIHKGDELLNKGVSNIVESLKHGDEQDTLKKDSIKSFSRIKINGNNKPLVQITFSRSGENSLQVLDNCVNVTICDPTGMKDKFNQSMEDTLTGEDLQINSLKRCQAFSAIQEARSTEDLYIDDDLSTQMQENFGGKVKLIPLHGSLHEILCEKEDDCCLVKVKQENGCDTIYFRCDNSDTESRDAIDGQDHPKDTVVYKRSISLIEERIQRIVPKDKRQNKVAAQKKVEDKLKTRPKSEIFIKNISKESRLMSNSSPSLMMKDDKEDVELNIENVMCYQDSSSEECLKCFVENDDFEMLEREIEEDIANSNLTSLTCGCLEKISEENLSIINEDVTYNNSYKS